MATAELFVQPKLSSINAFEEWLHEIEIWQCLPDLNKEKQGTAI